MSHTYDAFVTGVDDSFSPTTVFFCFVFFLYDLFPFLFAAFLSLPFLGLWLPLKYVVVVR